MEIHPGLSRWLKFNPKDLCKREAGESESERDLKMPCFCRWKKGLQGKKCGYL